MPRVQIGARYKKFADFLAFCYIDRVLVQMLSWGRGPSQNYHSFACKQAKFDIFSSQKVEFLFPTVLTLLGSGRLKIQTKPTLSSSTINFNSIKYFIEKPK